ncbi:MAG: GNAT family N-acetyltransferase [Candidatus Nanopelagicales bacterium]
MIDRAVIRCATAEDWPNIAPIFHEIVNAGETYAFDPDMSDAAARNLWLEHPPGQTVVAVVDEQVAGTAKMGPNRPARGAHVATASFMVSPTYQARGIGRALAAYAIEWAQTSGYRSMQFNAVVETNVAAVALWRSLGFEVIGTAPEAFDHPQHGLVGLHVMFRRL